MYPSPQIQTVSNNLVRVLHPDLNEPDSYLTVSCAAAATTLTVRDNGAFSNTDPQDLLLLEQLGSDTAEIVRVDGAITPGASLTTTATVFAHAIDMPVTKILFDQVEVSGAATAAGSKTTIATMNLMVNGRYTDVMVTGTTYAYYFARFKNSLATTPYYGSYSDAVPATDYLPLTPGFVRRNAFRNISMDPGGKYDSQWVYDQIYLCELDVTKELKRWGFLTVPNHQLGKVTTGMSHVSLPSNIEDINSQKSILGLRIGTGRNLDYIDLIKYSLIQQNTVQTDLSSAAGVADSTLTLTDSSNLYDAGVVYIAGYQYTYTDNDRTTGILTLSAVTGRAIASGTAVWQNIGDGEPRRFTVRNGVVYFDIPPSSAYNGRDIWLDYYKTPTRKTTDNATLDINDPQLYISWVEMAVKKEKGNGELSPTDISYIEYARRKALLLKNEMAGQAIRMVPDAPAGLRRPYSWWRR